MRRSYFPWNYDSILEGKWWRLKTCLTGILDKVILNYFPNETGELMSIKQFSFFYTRLRTLCNYFGLLSYFIAIRSEIMGTQLVGNKTGLLFLTEDHQTFMHILLKFSPLPICYPRKCFIVL